MHVFFVNGNPRAGKDTFVDMVVRRLSRTLCHATAFSAIDPVKQALDVLKVDWSQKTEADRLLLSEIGDALERHSSYKSQRCADFVLAHQRTHGVVFLYTRERGIMRTVEAFLAEASTELRPITTRRLLVTRPDVGTLSSNPSDAGVNHIAYDIEIANDGTLTDLEDLAFAFGGMIVRGELPPLQDPSRRRAATQRATAFTRPAFGKAA